MSHVMSCGGAEGGEGVEGGDSDWDDDQEAAFQEEKQLAYEVRGYSKSISVISDDI